jgi:predicted kinase
MSAGYVAIVDAASLERWQRGVFRDLAAELAVPFLIVSVSAGSATLRDRVAARSRRGSDASEAGPGVLEYQERTQEPIAPDEQPFVVEINADTTTDSIRQEAFWREIHSRLSVEGS